jgi:spore coat polysaccharide biosynthesis protein SpsF
LHTPVSRDSTNPALQPGKCVGIIQARMGSTRFPGKVLADLGGRPVLDWVIRRLTEVKRIDTLVVATSTNPEDDEIEEWCLSQDVPCFRGNSHDVLARFYQCARESSASSIVRITADCPLIEPSLVDSIILAGNCGGWDYFSLGGEFPDGLDCEWFTFSALEEAFRGAALGSEKEHVTRYFFNHPEKFKIGSVAPFHALDHVRLTVDEPEDLALLRQIVALLPFDTKGVLIEDVLHLLAIDKKLRQTNSHVQRNQGLARSLLTDREQGAV